MCRDVLPGMNAGASTYAGPSPMEGSGTAWVLLGAWALSPARPTPIHPQPERRGFSALLVSRQGAVVIHATKDFTVKTVQKAADLAMQAGSRLYTDSASSYRALKGYVHDYVNHTQKVTAQPEEAV